LTEDESLSNFSIESETASYRVIIETASPYEQILEMWGFGRRDHSSPSSHQQHVLGSRQKGAMKEKSKSERRFPRIQAGRSKKNSGLNIDEMNVNETSSGIEVSFDFFPKESREPPQMLVREQVISVKEHIKQRQRVYRTQFSVAFPPLKGTSKDFKLDKWRPKDHRIPLLGASAVEPAYGDAMSLLKHMKVTDELSAVNLELEATTAEIEALQRDRHWIHSRMHKSSNLSPTYATSRSVPSADWDISKALDSKSLNHATRQRLQQSRGNCVTMRFVDQRAKEIFLSKCAAKQNLLKSSKHRSLFDTVTLGPQNCKSGGAATNMRHVHFMSNNNGAHFGFFFSRDTGKSQAWGRLPPKLFRRSQEGGNHDIHDISYLSTGPFGCYFAEFRSGECWWGSAVDDREFHKILQNWDVHRVVFGPINAVEDERGNKRLVNSWIIIGRDGRAAWKNLPSRLHHKLESRLASWAAPAEVSLGPGDSYFVRFLDGTIDYCLPAEIATVCEHIERRGASITYIALHPEISNDYLIRHTELKR